MKFGWAKSGEGWNPGGSCNAAHKRPQNLHSLKHARQTIPEILFAKLQLDAKEPRARERLRISRQVSFRAPGVFQAHITGGNRAHPAAQRRPPRLPAPTEAPSALAPREARPSSSRRTIKKRGRVLDKASQFSHGAAACVGPRGSDDLHCRRRLAPRGGGGRPACWVVGQVSPNWTPSRTAGTRGPCETWSSCPTCPAISNTTSSG